MVSVGDDAPEFTAPLADGDVEPVELSTLIEEGAPLVLAFFPAAFTGVCTDEMSAFRDRLGDFEEAGAAVYGVSVDSPFTLNEFRDQNDLTFELISDTNRNLVESYGVTMDFADLGVYDVAKRSVFVVDSDGEITYKWVTDDPGVEPDYDEVADAAAAAA